MLLLRMDERWFMVILNKEKETDTATDDDVILQYINNINMVIKSNTFPSVYSTSIPKAFQMKKWFFDDIMNNHHIHFNNREV